MVSESGRRTAPASCSWNTFNPRNGESITALRSDGPAPRAAANTCAGGALPRAAATNNSAVDPARPSAPANSTAVSLWAVRLTPRSRSLIPRGDSPAASASSSWVSFASPRSCRSNPPNESAGCSAMAPRPSRPLHHRYQLGQNGSCSKCTWRGRAAAIPAYPGGLGEEFRHCPPHGRLLFTCGRGIRGPSPSGRGLAAWLIPVGRHVSLSCGRLGAGR